MRNHFFLTAAACVVLTATCSGAFGASINAAEFVDQDWNTDGDFALNGLAGNFVTTTGTGGTAPTVAGGNLTLTMAGATGGQTRVFTGNLTATAWGSVTDYIVTTRMRVDAFPDIPVAGGGNNQGINIFDTRGQFDRAYVRLEADAIYSDTKIGAGAQELTKVADITTTPGTFYTWQFEISQVDGAGAGTMDVFRRTLDTDPFVQVGSSVLTRDQAVAATQYFVYPIFYNASPGVMQGAVTVDYLQIGTAVPEPSSLVLVGLGGIVMLGKSRCRKVAIG